MNQPDSWDYRTFSTGSVHEISDTPRRSSKRKPLGFAPWPPERPKPKKKRPRK